MSRSWFWRWRGTIATFGLLFLALATLVAVVAWGQDDVEPTPTSVPVPTLQGGDVRPRGYYTWCDGSDKVFTWQGNLFVVHDHQECHR
jgi:hypothetical protein